MNEHAGQYGSLLRNIQQQLKDAQRLASKAGMAKNNQYLIEELRLQIWSADRKSMT